MTTIELKIRGETVRLTVDEAKALHDELAGMFGETRRPLQWPPPMIWHSREILPVSVPCVPVEPYPRTFPEITYETVSTTNGGTN